VDTIIVPVASDSSKADHLSACKSAEGKMKKNMGTVDRVIRTLIAIGIGVLYFSGRVSGTLAIILGVIALVFLVTSFVGRCPGYLPFGLSTRGKGPESPAA
jgi:hypothetical protein